MARRNIWMNPPLERLAEVCGEGTGRAGRFSAKLGEAIERYQIILDLTTLPAFSDDEISVLSETICGSVIDARKIRGMHLDVLDCASGTPELRQELSKRVEAMAPAERLVLVEKMGQ